MSRCIVHDSGYHRVWYSTNSNLLSVEYWRPDPAGKGWWDGTEQFPLATIRAAIEAIDLFNIPVSEAQAAMDAG